MFDIDGANIGLAVSSATILTGIQWNLPILTRFASWPLSTGDISRWRNDRVD